jgi:hypothetical protein
MELNLFLELMKDADAMMKYEIERMIADVQSRPASSESHSDTTRKTKGAKLWIFRK